MGDFVHLHVHSHYSLLDGTSSPTELARVAHQLGFKALALTDRGVLHGCVELAQACAQLGIKPIFGCELQVDGYQITALAETDQGLANLYQLSSKSFETQDDLHVTFDTFASHHQGLIVLSGPLQGEIPAHLRHGDLESARKAAKRYADLLGADRFYIELIDHGTEAQRGVNRALVDLARQMELPLVASNDVYYARSDQAPVRVLLGAIRSGRRMSYDEIQQTAAGLGQAFLKSAADMAALFGDTKEALHHTVAIAERCEARLFSPDRLPAFPGRKDHNAMDFLRSVVLDHAHRRFGNPLPARVRERLDHELNVIGTMGYADYFLIVWDIVRFARERSIAVGPGRGSSASSLVAYVLNITDVDPLAHGLVFERFLNPERVSMPDIDIDFCFERRGEVIEYIKRRYGEDRVAQIGAFGRLTARAAIRDVARVLGVSAAEVDWIAKMIPAGPGVTLASAYADQPRLKAMIAQSETLRRLFELSQAVEGLPRHVTVHAAGVVMSDRSLLQCVPMCKTSDGSWITQFCGEDLETMGFLKMDLLGLRTLTVVDQCVQLLRQKGIDPQKGLQSLDDARVYAYLRQGETDGLFQIETGMFKSLLKEVKPRHFDDLIAILALGRPGPMARLPDYLKLRHGEKDAPAVHPMLSRLLGETYGLMIYQEQVMLVAKELAGYRPGEADLLRRAMGKKDAHLMEQERNRFIRAATERGVDSHDARLIFEEMLRFAEYGFPKSHSAAYAKLTYQTAYLKVYYPAEFMVAQLNSVMDQLERVGRYVGECRRLGVAIRPPDINESDVKFTVDDGGIRYGLAAIKHVGVTLSQRIVDARGGQAYRSIEDFLQRMAGNPLPKRAVESLVRAGAFDALCGGRQEAYARWVRLGGGEHGGFDHLQAALFESSHGVEDPVISHEQMIRDEVELLGTYVAIDPLEPYYDAFAPWIAPERPPKTSARDITVAGVVTRTRVSRRSGQPAMINLYLYDIQGRPVEVTFFESDLPVDHVPSIGQVVVVHAVLMAQDDWMRIRGKRVIVPEDIPITLPVRTIDTIRRLSQAVRQYPGTRPVVLLIDSESLRIHVATAPESWVSGSDEAYRALRAIAQGHEPSQREGAQTK